MPGGRPIAGSDLHAALRMAGGDVAAMRACLDEDDLVADYAELLALCPPERLGLAPGRHAAIFAPLFGEFE